MQFLTNFFFLKKKRILFLILVFFFFYFKHSTSERNDLSKDELKIVENITRPTISFSQAEKYEAMTAGAGTINDISRNAYSQHLTTLSFEQKKNFLIGNGLFKKNWVSAPSSTRASDGLGPLFNSRSCQSCHIKDGRGQLPSNGEPLSTVVRIGKFVDNKLIADRIYGKQFQGFAVAGLYKEVEIDILKTENIIVLPNNSNTTLTKVNFIPKRFYYGQINKDTTISPRVSPQVIGMGLLESITDEDILKNHDPYDYDNDGISGRVNWCQGDQKSK